MKTIQRQRCVLTGQADLEPLYTLRNFPVFMGCVHTSAAEDLKTDMVWGISRGSGLIQLKELIPLDTLYLQSHGSGCIGKLWDEHHRSFARFIAEFNPGAVLELGGGHGLLSREYQSFHSIPWTIVEPNPSPKEGVKARYIKGFFDEHFRLEEPVDAIVHSHVFEHIYEPQAFMQHLERFMKEGQRLIFSVPNMRVMLERKYTNCLNFEHTVFLIEPYIENLLAAHGFELIKKEYFQEDHSIFYAAERHQAVKPVALPNDLYLLNKRLYLEYARYHEQLTGDLNQQMQQIHQEVFLFGAHVFSQYLLVFGLNEGKIAGILDNDPNKQGKRLYGTSLQVSSPKILAGKKNPVIILRAGIYNDEIKMDILDNINKNVVFLD